MGTTKDALENGDNPVLAFVIAIEGYTNLITTWPDTSAVVTAWAATSYSACIGGLETPREIAQTVSPFRPSIESDSCTFVIHSGENDAFGQAVFATDKTGGALTRLDASVDANDTTIATGSGDFAASGAAFIGTERFTYGSVSNGDFTVTSRGTPVPFAINGGSTFGREHRISQVAGGVTQRPYVSDFPRSWVGKWVGCWAHRVVDGVLDTKAQAQLIFSGKIADIRDGIASGQDVTVLDCTDTREAIKSAVLLGDQFSCVPQEGVRLTSGVDSIRFRMFSTDYTTTVYDDEELVVGTTVYGATHISAGYNTTAAVIQGIVHFLDDAMNAADLANDWHVRKYPDAAGNGPFVQFEASTTTNAVTARLRISGSPKIMGMLGFDIEQPTGSDDGTAWGKNAPLYEAHDSAGSAGTRTPFVRARFREAYSLATPLLGEDQTTLMDEPSGTWINQQADLPKPWADFAGTPDTSSGSWGFLIWTDRALLAKWTSDTVFTLWASADLDAIFGFNPESLGTEAGASPRTNNAFIRKGGAIPRYKQAILIRNDLEYIVSRIFASTGASAYNHATYDAFDYQLSADGGIPWDLLGDNFLNTLAHLNGMSSTATMTLLLEKPTKLEDVLLPELALRNAHLVMKDGGLVFGTPSLPSAGATTHTLTSSHKAAEPGSVASDWPDYERSRNTVITHLKIKYNRYGISNDYRNVVEVNNEQSKSDYGTSEPITIEARNSIDIGDGAGDVVSELINSLAADALAFYGKPLPITSRSIAHTKWFITPGLDSVAVTDSFLRTALDGTRGISAVTGWVTGMSQDWSTMRGTIQVVLLEEGQSNRVIYSPVMHLDSDAVGTDYGYDHANSRIYVEQHSFSLSSEDTDINNAEAGDLYTLVERSCADPSTPVTFDVEVDSVTPGSDYFTLTAQLPASNSLTGKEWYVISQNYGSAQSSQQADAYQGDNADGYIVDTVRNREWVSQAPETSTITAAVQTTRHEFPATDGTYWAEGEPVHPAIHRNLINTVNNLIGYRTAPQMAQMFDDSNGLFSTSETDFVLAAWPIKYYIGRGRFDALKRVLNVGVTLQQVTSGTATCRVTTSAFLPAGATDAGQVTTLTFIPPYNQATFTTTSTSIDNVTPTTMDVVPGPSHEYTWITVELKASANTSRYFGLHQLLLGPLA